MTRGKEVIHNKKLRSLTWKYFWQQKIEEVSLGIIFTSYFVLFFSICSIGFTNLIGWGDNTCDYNNIFCFILDGMVGILMIGIFLLIILMIWVFLEGLLGNWIRNNWKKASKRARKELK